MEINLLDSSFNFKLDPFEADFFQDCNAEMKYERLDSLMLNRQDCSQRTFHDVDCFDQAFTTPEVKHWTYWNVHLSLNYSH